MARNTLKPSAERAAQWLIDWICRMGMARDLLEAVGVNERRRDTSHTLPGFHYPLEDWKSDIRAVLRPQAPGRSAFRKTWDALLGIVRVSTSPDLGGIAARRHFSGLQPVSLTWLCLPASPHGDWITPMVRLLLLYEGQWESGAVHPDRVEATMFGHRWAIDGSTVYDPSTLSPVAHHRGWVEFRRWNIDGVVTTDPVTYSVFQTLGVTRQDVNMVWRSMIEGGRDTPWAVYRGVRQHWFRSDPDVARTMHLIERIPSRSSAMLLQDHIVPLPLLYRETVPYGLVSHTSFVERFGEPFGEKRHRKLHSTHPQKFQQALKLLEKSRVNQVAKGVIDWNLTA